MREDTTISYFLTYHPGSVVAVLDESGAVVGSQRYLPFGEVRTDLGTITQTDFGYTFQRTMATSTQNQCAKCAGWSPYKLDNAIANGNIIRVASDISLANLGIGFSDELNYLQSLGYVLSADGNIMIPPVP